jgi:hypothetical protein
MGAQMRRIMEAAGQRVPMRPNFEINTRTRSSAGSMRSPMKTLPRTRAGLADQAAG